MDILSLVSYLVCHHRGVEALSINAGKDERCTPEWFSLTRQGPPHPISYEDLIGAYHIVPVTIWIKSNPVLIPHLQWSRLDVL